MSILLRELCSRGLQFGLGFVLLGVGVYECNLRLTPSTNEPVVYLGTNPTIDLSPAAKFVEVSSPYLMLLISISLILLGLAICVVAVSAIVDAFCIHWASRRYPDEPWHWRAAWRRGTLPTIAPVPAGRVCRMLGCLQLGILLSFIAIFVFTEAQGRWVTAILFSLIPISLTYLAFQFGWHYLRGIVGHAIWRYRLTPMIVANPTKAGEPLAIEFDYEPRHTPTEEFWVRLVNRNRGFNEINAKVEQSPGRIAVRCESVRGDFIARPVVQDSEWQVWIESPRLLLQYAVPVFAVSSDSEKTAPA